MPSMPRAPGLASPTRSFNLDRLVELPDRLDNAAYRPWLNRADSLLLQTLERAVAKPQEMAEIFDLPSEASKPA